MWNKVEKHDLYLELLHKDIVHARLKRQLINLIIIKRKISNWRPISLINVDAKIGSKAIALRLQSVLPKVIHHNQHTYVKGRTISDAIRTIDDVLEYTE